MDRHARKHGFTLIELLVALSLFAILLLLAMPLYIDFQNNAQVRNAAEGMYNGVLEAQTTAVAGNTQVQFIVAPATGWTIQQVAALVDPSRPLIVPAPYQLMNGAPNAGITPTPPGATEITFDPFGRIIPNPDASATMSCILVTNNLSATARALTVVISNTNQATGTKLCDPAAASTEPQACPATACG